MFYSMLFGAYETKRIKSTNCSVDPNLDLIIGLCYCYQFTHVPNEYFIVLAPTIDNHWFNHYAPLETL
jgi:hypothetical protein